MLNDRIAPKTARTRNRDQPRAESLPAAEQVFYDAAMELGSYLRHNPYSPNVEACIVRFESAHLDVELWTEAERRSDAAMSAVVGRKKVHKK